MSDIDKAMEIVGDVARLHGMYDQQVVIVERLEAENARLKEEVEIFKTTQPYQRVVEMNRALEGARELALSLETDNVSLKTEVKRFEGEWLEEKKQADRYKAALEKILKYDCGVIHCDRIAKEALAPFQGKEKE